MRLQGVWARSSTGGSTPRAWSSAWTWPISSGPASPTPTRSTRPNTPVTCCLPTAVTWTRGSTPFWTRPGPGWASPACGPCSRPPAGPATTAQLPRPRSGPRARDPRAAVPRRGRAGRQPPAGPLPGRAHPRPPSPPGRRASTIHNSGGSTRVARPPRTRRYYLPGSAARTISVLLTLRDQVIAPILAGVKIRRHDHVPTRLTPLDQDYEHLRTDMATLFRHLGIQPGPAAA